MIKFAIVAREANVGKEIASVIKQRGHILSKSPQFVVSVGGDGTFLLAERKYPGIPKVQVRKDSICKTCVVEADHFEHLLTALEKGKYSIDTSITLEATVGKKKIRGMNEIQLHHDLPIQAIRFSLDINGRITRNQIVGDGLIVATPFGSTAYYYSVGGEQFKKGIGIGFNNPHARIPSFVVSDSSVIRMKLLRGPASVYADNINESIHVKTNQEIVIRKSDAIVRIVKIK